MLLRLMGVNAFAARGWGDSGDGGIGNRGSDRNSDGTSGSKGSSGSKGGDTNGRDSNGGNDRGNSGRGEGGKDKGSSGRDTSGVGSKGGAFGNGSDAVGGIGSGGFGGGAMGSAVGKGAGSFGGHSTSSVGSGSDRGFGGGTDTGGRGALGGGAIPGRDLASVIAGDMVAANTAPLGIGKFTNAAGQVVGVNPDMSVDDVRNMVNAMRENGALTNSTLGKGLGLAANATQIGTVANPALGPLGMGLGFAADIAEAQNMRSQLKSYGMTDQEADAAMGLTVGRDKALGMVGGMLVGATGLPTKAAKAAFGATGDMAVANAASKATQGVLGAGVKAGVNALSSNNESFGAYSDRVAASKPDHLGKAPGEGGNGREEPWFGKLQAQMGGQDKAPTSTPNTGLTPPAQAIPPKIDYVGGMANSDMGMGANANYRPSLANSYGSTGASGAYYGNAPASRTSTPQHANGTVRLG